MQHNISLLKKFTVSISWPSFPVSCNLHCNHPHWKYIVFSVSKQGSHNPWYKKIKVKTTKLQYPDTVLLICSDHNEDTNDPHPVSAARECNVLALEWTAQRCPLDSSHALCELRNTKMPSANIHISIRWDSSSLLMNNSVVTSYEEFCFQERFLRSQWERCEAAIHCPDQPMRVATWT